MADIIEVVRVIPQYSVVDLNKKRKNRSISTKFELSDSCDEVPTVNKIENSSSDLVHAIDTSNEHHPGEEEDAVYSTIADDSSPELILKDTKTVVAVGNVNTQISESNVTNPANSRAVKSFYTPISKITLDSNRNPQVLCYEDANYGKIPKKTKKQLKSCLRIKVLLNLSTFLVFTAVCSFSVITFVDVSSLMSKLDIPSDESGRGYEELLNSISSLQETLNSSIVLVNQRYEVLKSKTQQLLSTLDSLGQPSSPAASCAALLDFSPSSSSGHYWVRSSNGSAVHVYCDMTRSCVNITGGWTRVGSINITENDTQCPGNLLKHEDSNTCGVEIVTYSFALPHCSSVNFSVNSIRYSKVCGKIKAFPIGSLEAFHGRFHSINSTYVDGISLTHGHPRQHIWTLATGNNISCPCTNNCQANSTTPPPSFVGKDYFCDTGSEDRSNPLWNGGCCVAMNTCSSSNSPSPPWFYRDLPHTTTEDIEMRVCVDESRSNEDIAIETIEIYVQ